MAKSLKQKKKEVWHGLSKAPKSLKQELIELTGDEIKEGFRLAVSGEGAKCSYCKRGMRQPWAIAKGLEMIGAVGPQSSITLNLFQFLGVSNEEELRTLVHSGRSFESIKNDESQSLEDYMNEAEELLKMVFLEHPEWKAQSLKRLGSGEVR